MATVTGYTAERMKNIEDSTVTDGEVVGNNLILTTRDGTPIDAGNVRGPQGVKGDTGEVSQAQLAAVTGPSANAGNDLVNGTDTKLFFDHDKPHLHHIPKFADIAQRDAAIPTPVNGQFCSIGADLEQFLTGLGWMKKGVQPRFHVALTANYALTVDGVNPPVVWDTYDDPQGMINRTNKGLVCPVAGVMLFTWNLLLLTSSGAPVNPNAGSYLTTVLGAELRRGAQLQQNGTGPLNTFGSSGSTIMPVTAGQTFYLQPYLNAAGAGKTIAGSAAGATFWDGIYLGFS